MAFCTRCGKKLEEGDRFCAGCGAPVTGAGTQNTGEIKTERDKKRLAAGAVILFILACVSIFGLWRTRGAGTVLDHTEYVEYRNDEACFSLQYPEGYMVTEPDSNNVLITEGEEADFQVVVEYAFHTVSDCAIYSAKDFAEQIEKDESVLTDWIGMDEIQVDEVSQTKVSGRDCYMYQFHLQMDGNNHAGKLLIFDSDGEFGCYSYMCVINEQAKDAKLYQLQSEAMEASFKITGVYQEEGYTLYSCEESELQFMVRDEAMNETEETDRGWIVVYPVDGVYSEANIWIDSTTDKTAEVDVNTALENNCRYYFNQKSQTQYTSNPTELGYGRYPYMNIELQYYEKGEWITVSTTVFEHDGVYWRLVMSATEEYLDTAAKAASDILFSLKFDEESESSSMDPDELKDASDISDDRAAEVITEIEKSSGFVSGGTWEPLAAADDFNGDGNTELLAVYETKDSSGTINVMYDVWSLEGKKAVQLESEILYTEAGGNSGAAGIVNAEGRTYLAIVRKEPKGESFDNYYTYIPWSRTESSLEDAWIYMESHGIYGQEEAGRYILGDTKVSKEEFDDRQEDFAAWVYKLDLLEGAGNAGVLTFDEIR